jgi:hypothetical protein
MIPSELHHIELYSLVQNLHLYHIPITSIMSPSLSISVKHCQIDI